MLIKLLTKTTKGQLGPGVGVCGPDLDEYLLHNVSENVRMYKITRK